MFEDEYVGRFKVLVDSVQPARVEVVKKNQSPDEVKKLLPKAAEFDSSIRYVVPGKEVIEIPLVGIFEKYIPFTI